MTSYLVTIVTDHHQTCLKMRGRDKQSSSRKRFRKTSWRGGGGGKCTFEYVQDMRFSNNLDVYLSNSFSKFKPRKISRNRLPKLKCAKFYVMAVFKMSLY